MPKRSSEFLFAINRPPYQMCRCGWRPAAPAGLAKLMDNVRAAVMVARYMYYAVVIFVIRNRSGCGAGIPSLQIDRAARAELPELR